MTPQSGHQHHNSDDIHSANRVVSDLIAANPQANLDLESAIGDAFKQFGFLEDKPLDFSSHESQHELVEDEDKKVNHAGTGQIEGPTDESYESKQDNSNATHPSIPEDLSVWEHTTGDSEGTKDYQEDHLHLLEYHHEHEHQEHQEHQHQEHQQEHEHQEHQQENEQHQQEHQDHQYQNHQEQGSPDIPSDDDLEDAVGNAFKMLAETNHLDSSVDNDNLLSRDQPQMQSEEVPRKEDLQEEPQPQPQDSQDTRPQDTHPKNSNSQNSDSQNAHAQNAQPQAQPPEENEESLEAAIGDAFKRLGQFVESPHEPEKESEEEAPRPDPSEVHEDDENIEDAISGAFSSLVGKSESQDNTSNEEKVQQPVKRPLVAHLDEEELLSAIAASFSELMANDTTEAHQRSAVDDNTNDDLAGIVQNVVQLISSSVGTGINTESHGGADMAIPAELLQELASEITLQVHGNDEAHRADVPKIDDTVLAHFQKEAHKSDTANHDAALSSALASAVRSAVGKVAAPGKHEHSEHDTTGNGPGEHVELDLDKLQMNEIFQNAFNMAMQQPHELLTSLDEAVEVAAAEGKSTEGTTEDGSVSGSKGQQAAAALALSMKDAMEKTTEDETQAKTKNLSIAETLAFHRSSLSKERSQSDKAKPSTAEPMAKPTAPASNPQLSTILSSLSQRIQSGDQSQNIMLVIRQMTNTLMLSKYSQYPTTLAVEEVVTQIGQVAGEEYVYVDSFKKAKKFMLTAVKDDKKHRAIPLVDAAIKAVSRHRGVDCGVLDVVLEDGVVSKLSECYGSIFNAFDAFARNWGGPAKPDVQSEEYKQKVRNENRERKKRWREGNAERNKDNDLRSRVLKKANSVFGDASSPEKSAWMEEEFNKRREKRMAKLKKEDEEKVSMGSGDASSQPMSTSATSLAKDAELQTRVSNLLILFSELGSREDPSVVNVAASATIAMFIWFTAKGKTSNDEKVIAPATSELIHSLLDPSAKGFSKWSFLLRINDASTNTNTAISSLDSRDLLGRVLSANLVNAPTDSPALELLRSSQKRLGLEFTTSDEKRPRPAGSDDLVVDGGNSPSILSSIDHLRNSISFSNPGIFNGGNLKMPLYKANSTSVKKEGPSIIQKGSLPFISHKVSMFSNAVGSPAPRGSVGLRKPGSFQRPPSRPPQKNHIAERRF